MRVHLCVQQEVPAAHFNSSLRRWNRCPFPQRPYAASGNLVRRKGRKAEVGQLQAANVDSDWLTGEALPESVKDVEKYLLEIGWHRAWVDIVAERLYKKDFTTTPARAEAVVKFLERLGIPNQSICNMASIAPRIVGRDPDTQLGPVVEYIKKKGISGSKLVAVLEAYPKLLLYEVAPDGTYLASGKGRASLDVIDGKAGVSFWREGAAFSTAPVAPYQPVLNR